MNRFFVVFVTFFSVAFATYGADTSTAISTDAWKCLRNNGYEFAIVRCYRSLGSTDPNCPSSVRNAWAGGMAHVDAYIFPCPTCGNPAGQVKATFDFLNSQGAKFGMIWLDIEGIPSLSLTTGPQYWMKDQNANRNFMQGMMNEAKRLGINYGIYTSASQWIPIMGSWTGGSSRPLWYAHYDGDPSFRDFRPFGGWTRPAIKQFAGTTAICGIGIDKNWY